MRGSVTHGRNARRPRKRREHGAWRRGIRTATTRTDGRPQSRRRAGLRFERLYTTPGVHPVRRGRVGAARRGDRQRARREGVRAERRRGAQVLVADRDQRRGLEVLPRPLGTPRARDSVRAAHRPRRRHHRRLGPRGRLLRQRRGRRGLPRRAHPHPAPPDRLLQLAGLVQRRHRGAPAVLGLLHQLGRGHHGVDPRPGQDRGHALQVRLGHRLEPLDPALVARAARRRRHRLGPGLLHERLRRVRRRDQVAAARRAAPRRW